MKRSLFYGALPDKIPLLVSQVSLLLHSRKALAHQLIGSTTSSTINFTAQREINSLFTVPSSKPNREKKSKPSKLFFN